MLVALHSDAQIASAVLGAHQPLDAALLELGHIAPNTPTLASLPSKQNSRSESASPRRSVRSAHYLRQHHDREM